MRIHLAGCECLHYVASMIYTGHPYMLATFYHMPEPKTFDLQEMVRLTNERKVELIMDSGVFSMMFGAGAGKKYDLPYMIDYCQRFIETVKAYGFDPNRLTVVEMDVHKILGMDAVFRLREMLEKSGLNVMYVWHREEGIPGLEALARRYRYISVGCPELRKLFKGRDQNYRQAVWDLLARINATGNLPRVHLLGNTVMETMETHLAYSCDSTSWLSGVRFGRTAAYSNGRLNNVHIRSEVFQALRRQYLEQNPEFERWVMEHTEKPKFRDLCFNAYTAAMAYKQYQAWLDRKYTWAGDDSALKGRP